MLDRVITAVTDLPVIIQGALGSGLFALSLYLGQRISTYAIGKTANISRKRKRQALLDELIILHLVSTKNRTEQTLYAVAAMYRAAHHFVMGLVWLTLGLIFSTTIEVFGIVGYLGCLYYLLQCLRLLRGGEDEGAEERIAAIEGQLEALQEQNDVKK